MIMFPNDLVRRIAKETRLSQRVVTDVLNDYVKEVKQALAEGHQVRHLGLGTFYTRQRQEGKVRHIRTGEMVVVPAARVVGFRPGGQFKRRIAGKKSSSR